MPVCDITDDVRDFVDDYLSDYDWSDIEDELRRNIESEMENAVKNELKEFEISLAEKVGEAIDANSMIQTLRDELKAHYNGAELHEERIESLEISDKLYDDFLNRGFFGRLKWLITGK